MSQRFFFKLFAIAWTTIMLTMVFLPLVAAFFTFKEGTWKYGYTFLEINWKSNILVSLGIGMSLAVWNAFEFEGHRTVDMSQYLKPAQRYHFKTSAPVSKDELKESIESNVIRKGWTIRRWNDSGAEIFRRNFFMKDVVKITMIPSGLEISSRPRWRIMLVDMARNLSNIEDVSKRLKHLK